MAPWSRLGRARGVAAHGAVKITVTKELVREHFCGPGFHYQMNLDYATPEYYEQVLVKRWREMNPRSG